MPSSMIFAGLVVVWLLILVPAVARHRQEVARPSMAALSGRVLERPRRRQSLEVDVMHETEQPPAVATRPERSGVARPPPPPPPPAHPRPGGRPRPPARRGAPRGGPAGRRAGPAPRPVDGGGPGCGGGPGDAGPLRSRGHRWGLLRLVH
ncbi:MAG: hypothetical protein LH603_06175, partial [Pseudonocardia sp.]|nr:hypothetical protein [Pseudonocardia sp.]